MDPHLVFDHLKRADLLDAVVQSSQLAANIYEIVELLPINGRFLGAYPHLEEVDRVKPGADHGPAVSNFALPETVVDPERPHQPLACLLAVVAQYEPTVEV